MPGIVRDFAGTWLLFGAIALGSLIGVLMPGLAEALSGYLDQTILVLVFLLFFELRLEAVAKAWTNLRFIALALVCNFLIIPAIGFGVASLFLSGQPLFFTGLVIYFMAPCTDWFLGFTRLAKGNTALGAALLPINMILQVLLYPVYLGLFAARQVGVDPGLIATTVWNWFLVPFVGATIVGYLARRVLPPRASSLAFSATGKAIPVVIALLVVEIFAGNVSTILDYIGTFALILAAVFAFFVITFWIGELAARMAKLSYPNHALLTITTAARNAPLMLAITAIALPDQPLIYAALIIGMLVEFPHLTALTQILLRKRKQQAFHVATFVDRATPRNPST